MNTINSEVSRRINARRETLRNAAPDLLAELQNVRDCLAIHHGITGSLISSEDCSDLETLAILRADAAIAKARGEL